MNVIKEGHNYILDSFEGNNDQHLQFIEKYSSKDLTEKKNKLVTLNDGTTNEEVLKVLINRLIYLNNKMSCEENIKAIYHLKAALKELEKRTSKRMQRDVEGTNEE